MLASRPFSRPRGVALALAIAALFASAAAQAAAVARTTKGAVVHWTPQEVTVGLSTTVGSRKMKPAAVAASLAEAMAAWNALPEMPFAFVAADVLATERRPSPMVTVTFCRGSWKGEKGLLAHTRLSAAVDTGEITAATIEVNECEHAFVGPDDVAAEHKDLQAVLTHELGHVLGLEHSDDPEAVMFRDTGTVRGRRPRVDDRRGVVAIYGTQGTATALLGVPESMPRTTAVDATMPRKSPARADVRVDVPAGPPAMFLELPWPPVPAVVELDAATLERLSSRNARPHEAETAPARVRLVKAKRRR
jgi:predicted Zn-dependent protease